MKNQCEEFSAHCQVTWVSMWCVGRMSKLANLSMSGMVERHAERGARAAVVAGDAELSKPRCAMTSTWSCAMRRNE